MILGRRNVRLAGVRPIPTPFEESWLRWNLDCNCEFEAGAELGGCQGGHCPPKILLGPPSGPQKFSGFFLKVLHRPLTAPLVAKLAPPVAPPNENVWLRPWFEVIAFNWKCRSWFNLVADDNENYMFMLINCWILDHVCSFFKWNLSLI